MTAADVIERNKAIVGAFYEGGVRGDLSGFGAHLDPEFIVEAPHYLPWGGAHGPYAYLTIVLPQVGAALDFTRFRYESTTAEADRVVALIQVGVVGTDATIRISEHWTIRGDKAVALWVAYYEPGVLLQQLGRQLTDAVPSRRMGSQAAAGTLVA